MAVDSTVLGLIWPNFERIQDFMVALVTCKNKEELITIEGAKVVTTIIDFSDAQGQLTPNSVMKSCQNSNSSKLLWLILLLAIHPKMKALEWSQHFSQFKSMGFF